MTALSQRDLMAVMYIIRAALEQEDLDAFRREVLNQLRDLFSAELATFILSDSTQQTINYHNYVLSGRIDQESVDQYLAYFHRLDPHIRGIMLRPAVVTTDQLISISEFVKTEIYNDFFKKLNYFQQMLISLRIGKKLIGGISLVRNKGDKKFTAGDLAKAELIAPYLCSITERLRLERIISQRAAAMQEIASELPLKGKVILDEFLEPIYIDEMARTFFASLFPKELYKSEPALCLPPDINLIIQELKTALDGHPDLDPPREERLVHNPVGQPYKVSLRLVRLAGARPVYALCFEPDHPLYMIKDRWSPLGLSRREQEVALLVCQGKKNLEIAQLLFISEHTVANHLRAIYLKLGVSNRSSLIHHLIYLERKSSGRSLRP